MKMSGHCADAAISIRKTYIRCLHQTEIANRCHSAKCRWKVVVAVGAVEPAVREGLQGQGR